MSAEEELDSIVKKSLQSFYNDLGALESCGREREMVSLYALGYLVKCCRPNTVLYDSAQIGIEVAVQQLERCSEHPNRGKTVCKDLVIWPTPKMNLCKDKLPHNEPLAVMEWKVNHSFNTRSHEINRDQYSSDMKWLEGTSIRLKGVGFIGYAVLVDSTSDPKSLKCARVHDGQVEKTWFIPIAG